MSEQNGDCKVFDENFKELKEIEVKIEELVNKKEIELSEIMKLKEKATVCYQTCKTIIKSFNNESEAK